MSEWLTDWVSDRPALREALASKNEETAENDKLGEDDNGVEEFEEFEEFAWVLEELKSVPG